jgi:hypothetical protein
LNSFQVGRHYRAGTQQVQIRETSRAGPRYTGERERGITLTKEKDTRVGAKKRSPGQLWRGVAEESARSRTPTKWFKL